jgi:Domain of unknown function (DUF4396)
MIPSWLHALSIAFLILGFLFAAVIVADEFSHPQHMWIMNVVWPVVALFGSVVAVWNYFTYGRLGTRKAAAAAKRMGHDRPNKTQIPFPVIVGKGAAHCGSGCTLGDICAEWLAFVVPAIAVGLGWQSIFPDKIFAVWVLDCLFAHAYGIVFQYFTIAPMRGLGFAAGIWQAIKADTLSLTAWQIGMYGFMALAYFWFFRDLIGTRLKVNSVEFWFMMQIAMCFGFPTSYPVNWWLISSGVKERM